MNTDEVIRTLSMTFGRPAAIPDNYVKLDLPSKRDFDESSALVNDETTFLSLTFFNSTMFVIPSPSKA